MPAKKYYIAIFLLTILLLNAGCSTQSEHTATTSKPAQASGFADKFIIAGSGCNIVVTSNLAKEYRDKTGITIEIPESIGSTGAINAVTDGSIDLGLIAKALSPDERAAGLKEIPYAKVAVVFAAHQAADANLTAVEIIDILTGNKTTWSDGRKIYIFTRQANDSTNQVLYNSIPSYETILNDANNSHRWQVLYRNSDMINALKNTSGALGLATLPEIVLSDTALKPLTLNGIAPTTENILNGSYAPTLTLSFIYKNELSSRAAKFIEFVFSPEGQEVLRKSRAVPLGR